MKRNINVSHLVQTPIEKQRVELVERKCIGHPDSLADGVAEAISRALCKEYMDKGEGVRQNKTTAKWYFGKACDYGDQDGCDKYRILNEQGY